jgi:hypothetical protein
MSLFKIIFENNSKYNQVIEYKKSIVDQHSGFIETRNFFSLLFSAFKHYYNKSSSKINANNIIK